MWTLIVATIYGTLYMPGFAESECLKAMESHAIVLTINQVPAYELECVLSEDLLS